MIFDVILGASRGRRSHAQPSAPPRDPVVAAWWGGTTNTASGKSVTSDNAMRQVTVYACVRALAQTLAALPVIVYATDGAGNKARDRAHPLWDILHERPNRWQTPFEFKEMLMAHVALRGNAYAEIVATGGAAVSELIPRHPDRMRPFWVSDGVVAYEHTPETGGPRVLLRDEVLHVRGLGFDGLRGLNPIEYQRETIGASFAAEEYGARFWANDATPRTVIEREGAFKDDETFDKFKKRWQQMHGGVERHKVGVLEDGMKIKELGMSNDDAQFIETQKFDDLRICRVFGIPPHIVGILDNATFSNIEQQSLEFGKYTMHPIAVRFEQAFRRDLMTAAGRLTHEIAFLLDALLRADVVTRSRAYATGRQWGYLSANDVRRMENLNPIEGGDVYLSPVNMTPAEALAAMVKEQMGDDEKPE